MGGGHYQLGNGFTLIELLAVIAVLAILAVLVFPKALELLNRGYDGIYKVQIKSMEKAAANYVGTNLDMEIEEELRIELSTLIEEKYIKEVKDPKTKEACDGYVIATKENNQIEYTGYLKCGKNFVSAEYKGIGSENANQH